MDSIKLNGIDYPFLFAIKAQREMLKAELSEKDDIYFIWLGLKYGAMRDKKDFILTEEQLVDIFEIDFEAYKKGCLLLGEHMGKLKEMKAVVMKSLQ